MLCYHKGFSNQWIDEGHPLYADLGALEPHLTILHHPKDDAEAALPDLYLYYLAGWLRFLRYWVLCR